MKLSKTALIKLVKHELEELGFTEFKDNIEGSQGLFVKRLENGFYLTLGLIIHRYYDNAFTGAFYLSKTTRWSSVWGDIPFESYKRPGYFLTKEEYPMYADNEINVKGSRDIWWSGSNRDSVSDFLKVIELTERRFVNQPELIARIENSQVIKLHSQYAQKVIELVKNNNLNGSYNFLPTKNPGNIPLVWFQASESVLIESNDILNLNTVKSLAVDAYRQYELGR